MIEQEPSFGYRTVASAARLQQEYRATCLSASAGHQPGKRSPDRFLTLICASGPLACVPASRRSFSGQGPERALVSSTCAGSGPGAMAGSRWPSSSTATSASWGWHLSRSGKATTAASALEYSDQPLRNPRPRQQRVPAAPGQRPWPHQPPLHSSGSQLRWKQELITPHCPQQNGMAERVIRTLEEQCVHRQRFDSIQHTTRNTQHAPSATGSASTITAVLIRPLPCARTPTHSE